MLRLRPPRVRTLERRIENARRAPWSVRASLLGVARRETIPPDYRLGEWEIALGSGADTFDAARAAICRFEQFPSELVEVHPQDAPIAPGTVVALAAHAGGFHADFACRIVEVVDDDSPDRRRFGFSYATLEGHVERGEELFLIEHDRETDRVTYRIRAVSAPAHPLAWLVQPWIRSVQVQFGRLSARALRRSIGAPETLPLPVELHRRPPIGLPWFGLIVWLVSLCLEIATGGFAGPEASPHLLLVSFAALVALPAARGLFPGDWLRGRTTTLIWGASAAALALSAPLARLDGLGGLRGVGESIWFLATLAAASRPGFALLRGRVTDAEAGATLGLFLLPVGSVWALFARLDSWPGDFPPAIAELTALHFHYAGALFPILLGLAGRSLWPTRGALACAAYLALVTGVAIGISFSPLVEVISAALFIALVLAVGALQLRAAILSRSRLGKSLLAFGSLALFLGMGLAATYSLSEWIGAGRGDEPYSGGGVISIETMIPWHGITMAIGFALCSTLGWIADRETADADCFPRETAAGEAAAGEAAAGEDSAGEDSAGEDSAAQA